MKHIFVVNPAAGKLKEKAELNASLHRFLQQSGLEYEIHRTLNKAEVGTFVRQRASGGEAIRFYACGGDGTVCDVLNGMIDAPNCELAVFPCGTGNDFARNFTNPENFLDFEKLVRGTAIPVDVTRFNDTYSMNVLNIGADCEINIASKPYKQKLGGGSYAVAAVKVLSKPLAYRVRYNLNGEECSDVILLCSVGNGKFCGGGFISNPIAQIDDGLLDVCIVRPINDLVTLGRMLLLYRKGEHLEHPLAKKYVKYVRTSKFTLEALDDDMHIAIDGETTNFRSAEIECMHNAVKLVLPVGSEILRDLKNR